MKKIFKLILMIALILCLCSCKNHDQKTIKILAPEGIPSIALASLLTEENYEFTIVNGASVLSTEIMQNNYDIIVAPIILGAQLYTKNVSNYKLNNIITTGNSYIVSKEEKSINYITDLVGKTIASYGQNTAPDIALKAAINAKSIDINSMDIVYENSVADVLTNRFLSGENVDAILCAEPIISKLEITLKSKVGSINIIDIQEVLKEEKSLELLPQAGVFINKNIDNKNIEKFLNDLEKNIENLNKNPNEYVDDILSKDTQLKSYLEGLGRDVLINAIPRSNIVFLNAKSNMNALNLYFDMINKYNEKILNKGIINEGFYKE